MIPLYKLDKLPRTQRLRKIAKYFSMAEDRLCRAESSRTVARKAKTDIGIFSTAEVVFFTDAVKLLEKDMFFSPAAIRVFREAAAVFEQAIKSLSDKSFAPEPQSVRRALNTVKHILLNETGKDQADWDFTGSDGRLDPAGRKVFEGMFVYLEDIRSPFNVGAMFRTAESFGIEKIFLSPFCADPRHRRAQRTAMGCIDILPWERREFFAMNTSNETVRQAETESGRSEQLPDNSSDRLMQSDAPVFALETGGVPITEFPFPRRGLLIAGSEELGVSPRALAAADASLGRVSIPIYGVKASLNVSVAFGIALQAWVNYVNGK